PSSFSEDKVERASQLRRDGPSWNRVREERVRVRLPSFLSGERHRRGTWQPRWPKATCHEVLSYKGGDQPAGSTPPSLLLLHPTLESSLRLYPPLPVVYSTSIVT